MSRWILHVSLASLNTLAPAGRASRQNASSNLVSLSSTRSQGFPVESIQGHPRYINKTIHRHLMAELGAGPLFIFMTRITFVGRLEVVADRRPPITRSHI